MTLVAPNVCRHCGCSPEDPCSVCKADFGDCRLWGPSNTVCGSPGCRKAEQARQERNEDASRRAREDGLTQAGLRGRKGCAA
jgi:hypothetical protein